MKKIWTITLLLTLTLLMAACEKQETKPVSQEEGTKVESQVEAENEKEEIETSTENKETTITDTLGRQVDLPENPQRFICVGVGCLRLYTYAGPMDKLVGVEKNETEDQTGVPYSVVNRDHFKTLPIIGQGGPRNPADPEAIVTASPDVIFYRYDTDAQAADELQEKTGTPVVALSYGEVDVFNEDIYKSLELIGQITGEEARATEVVDTLKGYYDDLTERASKVAEADRPRVYVGGLGSKGKHGIESTRGNYMLTDVLNAINVADETGEKGSIFIDKEQLLEWDPDYVFIDASGYGLVKEDYEKNPDLYNHLTAVKEGRLQAQLPYAHLGTNIDTAIADVYNMGKILYPEEFSDIDPGEKADEIYLKLLGKTFYKEMAETYMPFGPISLDN